MGNLRGDLICSPDLFLELRNKIISQILPACPKDSLTITIVDKRPLISLEASLIICTWQEELNTDWLHEGR